MPESFPSTASSTAGKPAPDGDSVLTIAAISIVAAILSNVLHEGVGHGLTALLTGANSGLLTTVAWSSEFDSRLVEAGGTLANLAAAVLLWLALRGARLASLPTRYFLLIACAFNLFSGTGYFFFSGVTDFGDWAAVIRDLHPHWLWRTALIVGGMVSYFAAVLVIGAALVRYVGIPREAQRRLRKFTLVPYLMAIVLAVIAGVLNPAGLPLVFESALPATAGGHSGLLWLQYYISRKTTPDRPQGTLAFSYAWSIGSVLLAATYISVLGRGINLHR